MNYMEHITSKISTKENIQKTLAYYSFMDYRIVFTNGCFDILHRGHISYLSQAADLGDILIVGLNTDTSVKQLKDKSRPVQDEYSRALILASLLFVDHVLYFDETTPYELIKFIQPDILVKGSDYKAEDIVGYDIVTQKGGEVATIDFLEGYSTSQIVHNIKND